MAIAGDRITCSIIAAARRTVGGLGADFLTTGSKAPSRFAPLHHASGVPSGSFPLQPVPRAVFDDFARETAETFVWTQDHLCRQRARLSAAMLQRSVTGSMAAPADDAFVAGVAIVRSRTTELAVWGSHEAVVVRVAGQRGLQVIDYMLFDRPVSLTRWAEAMGTTAKDVIIGSPFEGATGKRLARDISGDLIATWNRIPDGYTMENPLLLSATGSETVIQRIRRNTADALRPVRRRGEAAA